jgi:hypothetical protein
LGISRSLETSLGNVRPMAFIKANGPSLITVPVAGLPAEQRGLREGFHSHDTHPLSSRLLHVAGCSKCLFD